MFVDEIQGFLAQVTQVACFVNQSMSLVVFAHFLAGEKEKSPRLMIIFIQLLGIRRYENGPGSSSAVGGPIGSQRHGGMALRKDVRNDRQ